MAEVSQDLLFTELESKQDSMLPLKHGLYASADGQDGDTCICVFNGKKLFGSKIQGEWHYTELSRTDYLFKDVAIGKDAIGKQNFRQFLIQELIDIDGLIGTWEEFFRIGSWAVHHAITNDFSSVPQLNYLQYATGDINESNNSNRVFIVPFGCKYENIAFYVVGSHNTSGSDQNYTFDLYVKKHTPASLSPVNLIDPITFGVTIPYTYTSAFVNVPINATLSMDEIYSVYVEQTVFPTGNVATKATKATSYFRII